MNRAKSNLQRTSARRGRIAFAAAPLVLVATAACSMADVKTGVKDENVGITHQGLSNHSLQVGIRCEDDFQYGWAPSISPSSNRCGYFESGMSSQEDVGFYYNLHGGTAGFENPDTCGWPCGYVDSVDLFFMSTHGDAFGSTSEWIMWDYGTYAVTPNMRLGASGRENMVFATYACNTHRIDSNTWARWFHVFAGGMVITTGAHDLVYDGNQLQGADYAGRLTLGESFKDAWVESVYYSDNLNTPAVIATGVDSTDCWNRINATIDTIFSTPVLRDGNIGYMCWGYWN